MIARLGLLCLVAGASMAQARAQLDWSQPWLQPHDARAAAIHSDEYAWRLFVALNWPAGQHSLSPTRALAVSAEEPAIWETWETAADIFRDDGADPGPYGEHSLPSSIAAARRFETLSLKDAPNLRHIVGGRMVPLVDPVSGAKRLTEIRMNRASFDYIRARSLYNLDGQLKILAAHGTVHFPSAAAQVKAKWRPIRADERSRYHSVQVHLPDGTTRLYGLTAMHIVTKDLPKWFWATFEHVDNPSLADTDGWQLRSHDLFTCGDVQPDCNRAPTHIGLEGTVWQYYRLRGTLTDFVAPDGRPLRLANSELEAGMQDSASCMTCHARASIGVAAGAPVRLQIFDTQTHETAGDPAGEIAGTPVVRRGFLGLPQAAWFEAPGADGSMQRSFEPLDYVWSLSKAHWKRGT